MLARVPGQADEPSCDSWTSGSYARTNVRAPPISLTRERVYVLSYSALGDASSFTLVYMHLNMGTKTIYFYEQTRFGRVLYELSGSSLTVSGRRNLTPIKQKLDLSTLRAPAILHEGILWSAVFRTFTVAGVFWLLSYKIYTAWSLPDGLDLMLSELPFIMSAVFAFYAFRSIRKVRMYRFDCRLRGPSLIICGEMKGAIEQDSFVAELERRISSYPISSQ